MRDLLSMVRAYSDAVQDGRTTSDILGYLLDEVDELTHEVDTTDEPGEDGVAGEAIDVMLCAIDMVFKARPDWTDEDILAYAERKCQKWVRKSQK